jgi:glycine dehydrogenase
MLQIKAEVNAIAEGNADKANNVLKNAPHTAMMATSEEWNYPYSRQQAVYPLPYVKLGKFWPSVGRVNNTHGDRNLICACIPTEAYQS